MTDADSDADAQSKFFASMERELLESFDGPVSSSNVDDHHHGLGDMLDFAVPDSSTASDQQQHRQDHSSTTNYATTSAGNNHFATSKTNPSAAPLSSTSSLGVPNPLYNMNETHDNNNNYEHNIAPHTNQQATTTATTRSNPMSIPKPNNNPSSSTYMQQQQYQQHQQQQQQYSQYGNTSQPNSYGSSGSAFMSSLLNSNATTFNATQLSHTPPTNLASSYEASHFGKRARSGSVSGRLRSASEYLEDKGLLDRQTKSLLKDLIIIGDEELQRALDLYETGGDPSALEQMISSGALQDRLPPDLDLLCNDLDLDFLTMHEGGSGDAAGGMGYDADTNIETIASSSESQQMGGQEKQQQHHHQQQQQQQQQQHYRNTMPHISETASVNPLGMRPQLINPARVGSNDPNRFTGAAAAASTSSTSQAAALPQHTVSSLTNAAASTNESRQPTMVSPQYEDDGIGDLDFNDLVGADDSGAIVSEYTNLNVQNQGHQPQQEYHHEHDYEQHPNVNSGGVAVGLHQPQPPSSASTSVDMANSPGTNSTMSEYERRMRSNSLFCALLNEPGQAVTAYHGGRGESFAVTGLNDGNRIHHSSSNPDLRHHGGDDPNSNDWMDQYLEPASTSRDSNSMQGIEISRPNLVRRSTVPGPGGGIGASLEQADPVVREPKKAKQPKKPKKEKQKKDVEEKTKQQQMQSDEEKEEHIPGSGRPRALSDPNLTTSTDEFGLRHVDRPDGWVGAYSPDSRKVRIEKFLSKRNHRVWSKTIKYDVRKNFADSRLRVKGRFVRKEDELLMRELMSLT